MREAWVLANECARIEEAEKGLPWPQPHFQETLGHAAAAVILACAALEASINEIYLQAVDGNRDAFPALSEDQVHVIAKLWPVLDARAPALRKHEIALAATGRDEMPPGKEPVQSAATLFRLRDMLVHFKPEWGDELRKHQRLEDELQGRFPLNQLSAGAPGHMLWLPGKCLGLGCARWACETAIAYHGNFAKRIQIAVRLSA